MALVLAQLARRHGGVEGYLDGAGVDGATRDALRSRLLDPS
jgi:Tyrosine phosphatase family